MITIGGVEYKTPYADLLPPLSTDEYEELRTDIIQRGIIVPVVLDELGNVIDGQHRLKIAAELGLMDIPFEIRPGMVDSEKEALAWDLNAHRRQMTTEQRRAYVLSMRQKGMSYRAIGDKLGIAPMTARGDILESGVQNYTPEQPESIRGRDGKAYPAIRPIRIDHASDVNKATDLFSRLEVMPDRPLNLSDLRHEVREKERAERRAEILTEAENRPLDPPAPPYGLIYADPPWRYEHVKTESRAIENQYPTMELSDICALPVSGITDNDCVLFLWATNPKLEEAIRVINAWGFSYRTNMVWVKDKIGMGYYARQQHELLLIATKGNPGAPMPEDRQSSVIEAPRTEHSKKPPEFYDLLERLYPAAKKVELFARNTREGWAVWGNQV